MSQNPPEHPVFDLTELEAMAAANAELFNAHVKAGMPPMAVAVMLGQMMGSSAAQGQQGGDGS
jgi:hypothetical protein